MFIKNYSVIINERKLCDQLLHSDIKWYKEMRKLTTGQCGDYLINNHLSQQK